MTTLKKLSKTPTEAAVWRRVSYRLNSELGRAYRIEAANTPGFPDVVWVVMGDIKFLELKAGHINLRNTQIKFIKECDARGVTVWIVWQHKVGGGVMVFPGAELLAEPMMTGTPFDQWVMEQETNG